MQPTRHVLEGGHLHIRTMRRLKTVEVNFQKCQLGEHKKAQLTMQYFPQKNDPFTMECDLIIVSEVG